MAKEKVKDFDTVNDGSHAIRHFSIGDFIIIFIIVILCLTCVLPFIHLAAKSISSCCKWAVKFCQSPSACNCSRASAVKSTAAASSA